MSLSRRDRRALIVLLIAVVGTGLHWVILRPALNPQSTAITQGTSVQRLCKILVDQRRAAAAVSRKANILQRMITELAAREKNLIQANTAAQAQARLLEILKAVADIQKPPLEINQSEFSRARQFDETYGEVSVSVTIQCTIDELLNLIADLTSESQIIATDEISLSAGDQRLKMLQAHVTVTALVHLILIPEPRAPQI